MFATRPLKLAALAATTAMAGVLFVPPAAAAPVSTTISTITLPASVVAPLGAQYQPAGPTFTITLSITIAVQGNVVRFVVRGNVAGRQFTLTLFSDPTNLGTFTADANGDVTGTFSTAGLAVGQHRLQAVATATGESQSAAFTVIAGQGSVVPAGNGGGSSTSGGGGLAFTGANAVVPLTTLGVVLLLAGGAAVVVGRRRQDDVA